MLEILTFTGIDARTDLQEVRAIAARYPRAEFAVLIGSRTGEDNPIFPPMSVVRNLRELGVQTALHLCGTYARQAAGEGEQTGKLMPLCEGFGRVQINLHGDELNPRRVETNGQALRHFAEWAQAGSVILQHRGPFEETPIQHPRLEYLFDRSEGAGVEGFEHWPPPPKDRRVGYAGGLGPHNIQKALEFTQRYPDNRMWLDMERNVRTNDYWLDLRKVWNVCQQVFPDGRPG